MEKRTLFVLVLVAVIALGSLYVMLPEGGLESSDAITGALVYREPRPQPVPVEPEPAMPVNTVQIVGIDIMGQSGFSTSRVDIKSGDSVVWTNKDPAMKKIVVTFQKDKTREFVNSPLLLPGDNFQYTFSDPGAYNFWNLAYAGEGVIVVSEE